MKLSIVIVSYNVKNYLKQTIESVIIASRNIDSEIIVIDNNSSDYSPEMVRETFSGVILIESPSNEGYGAACNRGIKASKGNFILILNPDTIVDPATLQVCLDFMNDHPEAGAVGAKMTDGNGRFLPESKRSFPSPLTSFFRMTGLSFVFKKSALFNRYYLGNFPDNAICRSDILTGAFMFVRRAAIEKAGLFDTDFFMYGEDIDFSWRIVQSGFVNYYLPQATITHFKGKSLSEKDPEHIKQFYRAMIVFSEKYFRQPVKTIVNTSVYLRLYLALFISFFRQH